MSRSAGSHAAMLAGVGCSAMFHDPAKIAMRLGRGGSFSVFCSSMLRLHISNNSNISSNDNNDDDNDDDDDGRRRRRRRR
jgi:hypothetical protein